MHTKPVLQAILKEEYEPARQNHGLFIRGREGRNSVVKAAGERGVMDPRDVGRLEKCLMEWCLREEARATRIAEEGETGQSQDKLAAQSGANLVHVRFLVFFALAC